MWVAICKIVRPFFLLAVKNPISRRSDHHVCCSRIWLSCILEESDLFSRYTNR